MACETNYARLLHDQEHIIKIEQMIGKHISRSCYFSVLGDRNS